jgi:hypothetical protein
MFDTEGGSEYVAPLVKRLTDSDLIGLRSRSFDDLMKVAEEAIKIGASVLIVDSITHPWRELCDAYLKGVNDVLKARGKPQRTRIEFSDINPIKQLWAPWPDWYLNSRMHIVICGRAGFEWEWVEKEDGSGKKELVKAGIKMKTETEFGFEPSLLVEMERDQAGVDDPNQKTKIIHQATVIKDRFQVLDGAEASNPGFEFFLPHINCLTPGQNPTVNVEIRTDPKISDYGDSQWVAERKLRTILCEEIEGELLRAWPGQTKDEKQAKAAAVEAAFGKRSWSYVETLTSDELRTGLEKIRELVATATGGENGADSRVA